MPEFMKERVRESTFEALKRMVAIAIREQVDFVILSGDVFDLADRSLRAQIRLQKALDGLDKSQIHTYIVHGNHDPANGRRANLRWPDRVHFFNSSEVETVCVDTPDRGVIAQVHGISYPTAAVRDNLSLKFQKGNLPVFQIGVLHANVDGDALHEHYAPCTKQDLIQRGMDYWALGHVHTRKIIHEQPYIIYPGNIQGRNIRELGAKGCFVVNADEAGHCEFVFHELDSVRFVDERIQVENLESEQALRDLIMQHIERIRVEVEHKDVILRLHLEGRGPVHQWLKKGKVIEELLAHIREEELSRLSSPTLLMESLSLSGKRFGDWSIADELTHGDTEVGSNLVTHVIWLEAIEDQTANEIDYEARSHDPTFLGDIIRFTQELQKDEDALAHFAHEALTVLKDIPQSIMEKTLTPERLKKYVHDARELTADLFIEGGNGG